MSNTKKPIDKSLFKGVNELSSFLETQKKWIIISVNEIRLFAVKRFGANIGINPSARLFSETLQTSEGFTWDISEDAENVYLNFTFALELKTIKTETLDDNFNKFNNPKD